ncbi:MAG: class I SAM-dependent methyltransferase [Acidobacteriia bacterium]|nr:class I SAM-dependent methyltransferase [Terriglobia bacterium]
MAFVNVYEDAARAEAYSRLEFANTYYLAFRDLPEIAAKYAKGRKALDFGCGTGRSSRFLKGLGFEVTGVDISEDMLRKARQADPNGDYRRVAGGDLGPLAPGYDLALSAFTFDNIPAENKLPLFTQLATSLKPSGVLVNLVSSPEIYWHEWASFSTRDYAAQNRKAKDGDTVLIVTTDIEDRRPCADVLCTDHAYLDLYAHSRLQVLETRRPMATGKEPYRWLSETTVAPWVIWVLRPQSPS